MPTGLRKQHKTQARIQCPEHRRVFHNLKEPHQGDAQEPEKHHGAEDRAEPPDPESLDNEEQDEDCNGCTGRKNGQARMDCHDSFHGTEYGNGRSQRAVAEQKGRAECHDRDKPESHRF